VLINSLYIFFISYYALRFSFYIYVINENLFSKTVKLFYAVIRQGAALPCNKSRQLFYSPHGGFHGYQTSCFSSKLVWHWPTCTCVGNEY